MIIAIDGTSGSGKSYLGKQLARNLNYAFLSSGSIYRAMALSITIAKLDPHQEDKITDHIKNNTKIEIKVDNGLSEMYLNGKKVVLELRTPEVTYVSAIISKIPKIREIARYLQHKIADECKNIVVDGRDIGSVVFPNADIKFFVTADIDVRAKRRLQDYLKTNSKISLSEVKKELIARDQEDTNRKISPLIVPKGAIIINTSNQSREEIVNEVKGIVLNYIKKHS